MLHTAWTSDPAVGAVFEVQQDSLGFLWLTTSRGVLRFDGARFETLREVTLGKLRDNDILSVFASKKGAIWFVTRNAGLKRWANGNWKEFPDRRCTPTAIGGGIAEDQEGNLWFQAAAGLSVLRGSSCEMLGPPNGIPKGMPAIVFIDRADTVWVKVANGTILEKVTGSDRFAPWNGPSLQRSMTGYMHQAPDGSLWLSDDSGLRELLDAHGDRSNRKVLASIATIKAPLGDFAFSAEGRIWLASNEGLLKIPASWDAGAITPSQHINEEQGLSSSALWRLLLDRQGNLWVGTNSGLDRLRPTLLNPLMIEHPQQHEFAVVATRSSVWFGNSLMPLKELDRFNRIKTFPSISSILTLRMDRAGRVWAASQSSPRLSYVEEGIVHSVAFPSQDEEPILSLAFDRDNHPWIVNRLGTVFRFDGHQWVDQAPFLKKRPGVLGSMTADEDGSIWIAFSNKLFHWSAGHYQAFSYASPELNISASTLYAKNGHVWLAGRGGLVSFSKGRFALTSWEDADLPGRISGVVESKDGDLWLNGFSGGVFVAASEIAAILENPNHPLRARRIDTSDGLPGFSAERIPEPSLTQSADGRIWFATTKGIASVDSFKAIRAFGTPPPRALVTSLTTDGESVDLGGAITLHPSPHRITFSYSATDLSQPERIRFRYQLSGMDDQWQNANNAREISYSRVSPGRHVFRLSASTDGLNWSDQESDLTFNVAPTFYQTFWFRGAFVLLGILLLYLLLRYRLHRQRMRLQTLYHERLAERERIARELHDTLLQGFHGVLLLFQTAGDLVRKGHPAKMLMEEALQQTDKILLEGRDRVLQLRGDKITGLEAALHAIGQTWKNSRATKFDVVVLGTRRELDQSTSDEIYLIAKEAISNAFRHAQATRIVTEIEYAPRTIRVSVRDDGRGINQDILERGNRPGHWGIPGMRERSATIGASLAVISHSKRGTEVVLQIPSESAQERWSSKSFLIKGYRLISRGREVAIEQERKRNTEDSAPLR